MNLDWLTASPWPILALVFGAVALLVFTAWLLERRAQAAYQSLLDHGEPAEATVLGARDTGWRTNRRPHIAFTLEVRRVGHPPYQATTRLQIHRPWTAIPYPPGTRLRVRVDPERPERVAIERVTPVLGGAIAGGLIDFGSSVMGSFSSGPVTSGNLYVVDGRRYASPAEMPPADRALYDQLRSVLRGDDDGLPAGPDGAPAAADPRSRLRELKTLLDEGLITPAEYAAKKAQILEHL